MTHTRLHVMMLAAWICPFLPAAETSAPKFAGAPACTRTADGKCRIDFALDVPADVEVAILDARGGVIRHLAAGVLGAKDAPPAPLTTGLAQSIVWDGRDDYGMEVSGVRVQGAAPTPDAWYPTPFQVRVRAGMGVKLEKIAGGDPYAFFSKEMGAGDHFIWKITGLDVKADGSVFVMGNANNYGPPAIRQYAADGTYQRTVYPFPAGRPVASVQGWGVNVRADGTYSPGYSDLSSPALSRIPIAATRAGCASLLPSPRADAVSVSLLAAWDRALNVGAVIDIGTDGSLPENKPVPLFDGPKMDAPGGSVCCAYSPDGKFMYVNGLFSYTDPKFHAVQTSGFWRDGQVWKVDLATRKPTVFFALDEKDALGDMAARRTSPIGHQSRYTPYAALQGVAVDNQGNVLVGDRQNKRIVALDPAGKVIREIPVAHVDAIALDPASKALYVTTRTGDVFTKGEVKLLKFNDWSRDTEPAVTSSICPSYGYSPRTFLGACRSGKDTLVWLAYTTLPVHIYRDNGNALELFKDFYAAGQQRALDMQHIVADPKTDHVYVSDGSGACFRIADWKDPKFVRCMQDEKTPLRALNLAIDARHRLLYGHADRKPVVRYRLDGEFLTPVPVAGATNAAVTPAYNNDWRIGLGLGDRGLAVAPDGSVVTLGALLNGKFKGDDYGGYLHFFRVDAAKAPWQELFFQSFGAARSGGVRFDPQGNLYVGKAEGKPRTPPAGFEKDGVFLASIGRIYKYAPTGTLGNLFPTEPAAPARTYEVNYGALGDHFSRTARFGVDGYGRIYYPTSLEPRVSVIDNAGNPVVSFGTYGNRDSPGGLPGGLVPSTEIPLAWPNSVDATDDYIYVSDIVNIRILRIAKTFALEARANVM